MKFSVSADWHIRPRHLGVARRGEDFTKAAIAAIEASAYNNCAFMINGGDLLNESRPSSESVRSIMHLHEVARSLGHPILLIDGNHDFAEPSWYDTIFPPEEHEESLKRGGFYRLTGKRILFHGLQIAGLRIGTREMLLEDLTMLPPTDIVVWHGAWREMAGYESPDSPSLADIPVGKFQAIVCGDIHKRQWVGGEGATIVGYPGATELVKRDDPLEHSITVFDTSHGTGRWTWEDIPIPTRPVYVRQVRDHNQLEELIAEFRKIPQQPWPIIFVRYDRDIPDVKERLFAAINNPDALVRIAPAPPVTLINTFLGQISQEPLKKPHEFLSLVQHDPSMSGLLMAICANPEQSKTLIETWVDAETRKITSHAAY